MITCISGRKISGHFLNGARDLKEVGNICEEECAMRDWMLCSHEFSFCPIELGFGKKRKAFDGGKSLRWGVEPVLHLVSVVVAALSMPLPFFTKEVKRSCALETLMLATYTYRHYGTSCL
ncbi:hypothetical protein BRADI_2g04655v3 [Brachypodium distachyon]|uniref:Uncharacterized protein n=1 Tax=Brachypodium distachyon TaxID=15368 RepID=A0A2K2D6Z5_BRADI|nr:hypothetical protein BRADI_2g04655v3 [Brachypodium distachyon]